MLAENFDMKDLGEAKFVLGIEIIRDRKRSPACRLMDIKCLKARDEVRKRTIDIQDISKKLMVANPTRKALPVGVFKRHVFRKGIRETFDLVNGWE